MKRWIPANDLHVSKLKIKCSNIDGKASIKGVQQRDKSMKKSVFEIFPQVKDF